MRTTTRWMLRATVAGAAVLGSALTPVDVLVSFSPPTTHEIATTALLLHGSGTLLIAAVLARRRHPARSR